MLKIGDFSKLAQVTVKTLRHYDQLGLLKPAWTDRYSGYRYYTIEQMPRLNRILALKDLGFSLDQVAQLLDEQLSAEQLRGIVLSKRVEVQQRVQEEQRRLVRVETRLKQIEQEGCMPVIDVVLKKIDPQQVVSVRDMVPNAELLPERCDRMRREVNAWLESSRLHAAGPWIVIFEGPEYVERNISVQMARALEERVRPRAPARLTSAPCPAWRRLASLIRSAAAAITRSMLPSIPGATPTATGSRVRSVSCIWRKKPEQSPLPNW